MTDHTPVTPPHVVPRSFVLYHLDWWSYGRTTWSTEDLGIKVLDPWPTIQAPDDLQEFTGYEPCPRCGSWGLHWMEKTRTDPPVGLTITPQVREELMVGWG